MPISLQTSRPTWRHPVTGVSLRGWSCSAKVRSGSSGETAVALASILAANAVRRAATGRMPASAMTPWCGADRVQPVTILAASRISRSSSSTLVLGVAGSQAVAACSNAPRT